MGYLAGPTASGKSALAVEAALRAGLAVISADSMQVYRGMEVGTGVIPTDERKGVPHHLLSCAEPTEDFHAARFVTEARVAAAAEWHNHGRRCLVVGGTGLWIEALREGLFAGPGRDEAIRARLRREAQAEGLAVLHARLAVVDPESAGTIHRNDEVRIVRALEVHELSGKPLSIWYAEDRARRAALDPLPPLIALDRPREEVDARIDIRVDQMLRDGWLDEARRLEALSLDPHAPAGKALGYRELIRNLRGELAWKECVAEIKLRTRQFVRSQMTWFRARRGVILHAPGASSVDEILQMLDGV